MWLVQHGGTHGQGATLEEALEDLERNADAKRSEFDADLAEVKATRSRRNKP